MSEGVFDTRKFKKDNFRMDNSCLHCESGLLSSDLIWIYIHIYIYVLYFHLNCKDYILIFDFKIMNNN